MLNANTNAKYTGTVAIKRDMLNVSTVHETAKVMWSQEQCKRSSNKICINAIKQLQQLSHQHSPSKSSSSYASQFYPIKCPIQQQVNAALSCLCSYASSHDQQKEISKKTLKMGVGNRVHRIENSSLEKGTSSVNKQCWVSVTISINGATTPMKEKYTHAAECYAKEVKKKRQRTSRKV